jgi:CheY-like chemotaxis protein
LFPSELSLQDFLWDVADTFKLRIDAKGIGFTTDISPDLPTSVIGDETKIRQILNNLIGNAIKFTNEGEVTLRVYPYQQHIRFQVEDTGIGIPKEGLEKIFQAFHQIDTQMIPQEGIGMGLAISNKLAELMGGTLSVASEQGKGSNFCFEVALPTVDADLKKQQTTQLPIINYIGHRRTVLIADDAINIRSLMTKLLTRVGFNVEQASNGQECLEKATEIQPDIILMDIVMPVIDGLEATRQIRQLSLPNNPVIIAISAKAFSEDAQQCLTVGCDDFMPKPIKLDKLLDKIAQHLDLEWDYSTKANTDYS